MEQHEAVKIRVEGLEVLCLVHGVEVVDIGGDLHLTAQTVLDDAAKGVRGRALGERELCIAVGHGFGADEDEVQQGAGEHVRELEPDIAREGRLGAGTEDENADWRRLEAQTLDVDVFTRLGRVQGVAES